MCQKLRQIIECTKTSDYLIGRGILSSRNISSNTEVPWKIETACHFAGLVKYFIQYILRDNESDNKLGIEAEFKLAFELP